MTDPTPPWRTSSFSSDGGSCVQVADCACTVLVRNSNRTELGSLRFDRPALAAFVAGCRAGQFDDLAVDPPD